MKYKKELFLIILFISLSINAQIDANKIHIRDLNSKSVEVAAEGKIYNYGFIFPDSMLIDSYFVSTSNDIFYIKYEFRGSAISKYYDLVGFKWKDGNLYIKEYVIMNNQKGKWTGLARMLNEKLVKSYDDIESVISSFQNENEINIIKDSRCIGKMKVPKKISKELVIDDKILFEILSAAKKQTLRSFR